MIEKTPISTSIEPCFQYEIKDEKLISSTCYRIDLSGLQISNCQLEDGEIKSRSLFKVSFTPEVMEKIIKTLGTENNPYEINTSNKVFFETFKKEENIDRERQSYGWRYDQQINLELRVKKVKFNHLIYQQPLNKYQFFFFN